MPYSLSKLASIILILSCSLCLADISKAPALTLAKVYKGNVDLTQYWVSEKLDGVRAYWDGHQLISRQGNIYPAPTWFIKGFPKQALDGELWLGRGQFQALLSIVKKHQPIDNEWQRVRYFVFDLPLLNKSFKQRLIELQQLVQETNSPFLKTIEQYQLSDESALMHELDRVVALGAEGLMLHHGEALYHTGRNSDLLKVKPYSDAEATVIGHIAGKGKYKNMLGSLLVETEDGIRFKIGSGLSDSERSNPPQLGSLITFTYHGKTLKGIPKFASFLRIRKKISN